MSLADPPNKKPAALVNAERLRRFLTLLNKELGQLPYLDLLHKLDSEQHKIINDIHSSDWLDHRQESTIVQYLCDSLKSYTWLYKSSRQSFNEFLIHIVPHNPFLRTIGSVIGALPSFIGFWLNTGSCTIQRQKQSWQLTIRLDQNEKCDLVFISAAIAATLEFLDQKHAAVFVNTVMMAPAEARSLFGTQLPWLQYQAAESQFIILLSDTISLDETQTHLTAPRQQISLGSHKESQRHLFVRQVLSRSARIFQDKRELTTAVEFLNYANEELEKKIDESDKELQIARNIQKGLIPQQIPNWNGLHFWCHSEELTGVSGDLYDYFNLGNQQLGFLIADVCGHGVPAALISALAKISFSNHSNLQPSRVLANVNLDLIRHVKMEGYLTAIFLRFSADLKIQYSIGGMPAPLLYREQSHSIEQLEGQGSLIGMFPDAGNYLYDYESSLTTGDKLFLFSDGLTELANTREELLGLEGLKQYILETSGLDCEESGKLILSRCRDYSLGQKRSDDLTLIVIEASPYIQYYQNYVDLARLCFKSGDLEETIEALRKALHIFPDKPEALYSLAKALLEAHRLVEAENIADQLLSLMPEHVGAMVCKSICAREKKRFQLAENLLQQAQLIQKNHPLVIYYQVQLYAQTGRTELAQKMLAKYGQDYGQDHNYRQMEAYIKRLLAK